MPAIGANSFIHQESNMKKSHLRKLIASCDHGTLELSDYGTVLVWGLSPDKNYDWAMHAKMPNGTSGAVLSHATDVTPAVAARKICGYLQYLDDKYPPMTGHWHPECARISGGKQS
jgi:hypothetical protein